ncbi:hypothetical protein M8C21_000746, partial [Ambrosia artemisiifolia]
LKYWQAPNHLRPNVVYRSSQLHLATGSSWSDHRKRFEIELKHGQTTIVSWVQLLKDSGISVDQSPPSSPDAQIHEEDESRINCSKIVPKKEKDEHKSPTREHCRQKKQTAILEATKKTKIGHASTILELETMAADSRKLHGDVEDVVGSKSRLPRELKIKLESVARLAHSSHGRISDGLIMHLMSILGHWLKPKTLKDGSDNETMELHAASKAKYSMDHELEDKICDFYDIYVQGMDEIKSSEIRKFYIQLAALWPTGTMDNHGVRNAICSSKERRRTALQEKGHEKGKRKTVATPEFDEDIHGKAKLVATMVNDTNAPVSTFLDTAVPGTPELDHNLSPPAKRFSPPSPGSCQYPLE